MKKLLLLSYMFFYIFSVGSGENIEKYIIAHNYFEPLVIIKNVPTKYQFMIKYTAATIGISPEILAGIAYTESSYRENPEHINNTDKGMFGLHESKSIHKERSDLYGEYDATDPWEAARIAALILLDHYEYYNSWSLSIAAYHQGRTGLKNNNAESWYVARVLQRGTKISTRNQLT
ncbi:MAG TPA: transglycosylase SLT domain-containing protein [Dehalococcoidia bacterium]|nr:transglycosylase SLT domain-containing protein [Dehalococcoidia bacterium]